MKTLRRFLWTIAFGGFLGAVLAVWFSPRLIEWYFAPPTNFGITCKEVVPWAIEAYRKVVIAGVLAGLIFSGILFFAFSGHGGQKPTPNAPGSEPKL